MTYTEKKQKHFPVSYHPDFLECYPYYSPTDYN